LTLGTVRPFFLVVKSRAMEDRRPALS
jgi:hypothetical protein